MIKHIATLSLVVFLLGGVRGMAEEIKSNKELQESIFTDGSFKKNHQLTPKEATEGALKTVQALSDGAILSPELIHEQTGIILKKTDNKDFYHYGSEFGQSWGYSYKLNLDDSLVPPKFSFEFLPRSDDGKKPSMVSICEIDVDMIHPKLLAMGFTFKGMQRGGFLENKYTKGYLVIRLGYQGESPEKPTHDCMRILIVSVLKNKGL